MTINTWPVTFLFSTRDSVVFIPPHPGCRSTFLFFTQPVSHCQSHFKSVSCFNLLNLIFPQLSDSFPLPLLPASHWIPPPSPPSPPPPSPPTVQIVQNDRPFHPILAPIDHLPVRLKFPSLLLTVRLSHLSLLLAVLSSNQRGDYFFFFSHLWRSIKKAPERKIRIENWCYL